MSQLFIYVRTAVDPKLLNSKSKRLNSKYVRTWSGRCRFTTYVPTYVVKRQQSDFDVRTVVGPG